MTVSFQLNTPEELSLITSMLLQLKQSGIPIQVIEPNLSIKKGQPRSSKGIAKRLHGIIKLPTDFDYKSFIADELLAKHG